jgi:hypothetical protein
MLHDDGVRDNPRALASIVRSIRKLIVGVIHFNPGGEKTRGHLGSQLERKAETNLRLDKVRRAPAATILRTRSGIW